jgi:hypothetical protein
MPTEVWSGNKKHRDSSENLEIYERIPLKLILIN